MVAPVLRRREIVAAVVSVAVTISVAISVAVAVAVTIAISVAVTISVAVAVAVAVTIAISVAVAVTIAISVAFSVAIAISVAVSVAVAISISVAVAISIAVSVAISVTALAGAEVVPTLVLIAMAAVIASGARKLHKTLQSGLGDLGHQGRLARDGEGVRRLHHRDTGYRKNVCGYHRRFQYCDEFAACWLFLQLCLPLYVNEKVVH
jgi:hypothetical protein